MSTFRLVAKKRTPRRYYHELIGEGRLYVGQASRSETIYSGALCRWGVPFGMVVLVGVVVALVEQV